MALGVTLCQRDSVTKSDRCTNKSPMRLSTLAPAVSKVLQSLLCLGIDGLPSFDVPVDGLPFI